jgi:hypothetical protein
MSQEDVASHQHHLEELPEVVGGSVRAGWMDGERRGGEGLQRGGGGRCHRGEEEARGPLRRHWGIVMKPLVACLFLLSVMFPTGEIRAARRFELCIAACHTRTDRAAVGAFCICMYACVVVCRKGCRQPWERVF